MNNNKYLVILFCTLLLSGTIACKKELNVGNPNLPTVEGNVNTESGLVALSVGAVYVNGFKNGDDWLGNSYFSLPYGYSELLADVVGAQASNQLISTISIPEYYVLDNNTQVNTSLSNISQLRANNTRAQTGAGYNPLYYQWLNMYAMNSACNTVLSLIDNISFSGDATTRANTIKIWCYWWKGYAYASIGSMYYSGLIVNEAGGKSNHYVVKDSVLAESNKYFNMAASLLQTGISSTSDYQAVLTELIPSFCQVGNGGVLTTAMWIRNINTMLARNLLVNKLAPFVNKNPNATIVNSSTTPMTAADWNTVLTLAGNGIQKGDYVFTGRSAAANGFFTASGGTVASLTTGVNTSSTFRLSERFVQNFASNDKRLSANFNTATTYLDDISFGTRYSIIDGGGGDGVYMYGSKTVGAYELFIAGSYEENALMLAEANIRLNNTDAGLAYIDAVRDYMGAGVTAVAGTGLSETEALNELVKERRVALVFRGLSFYDSRRWGWTYDVTNGGGSYGNTFLTSAGTVNTNVTINYDFLDYWDVPADESDLNPPGEGSAAVKNPNF
ncbi:RagB/SusD family nutrient uptake outer membrane protein [Chitinophaga tropicalis]|uniref:RagB/SusD family nutrient uptake outer membrane protein n=1 Tax=Chitinophaga tropicalis TaxID=2683588 RepID=A0A7K1U6B0_9BACT|nr:RagB/SusD family nutrient uptake outer membrane protein [Chitinophaga tropicalis]MVT09898.1 RagB/SusD family nutrient uptake outer membrane protein [Chitinophaga tropicalis]